jgi:anti-anti-sigma factor
VTSYADPVVADQLRIETVDRSDATWVVLCGEADIATLQQLEFALTRIQLRGVRSVHFHVTALDFADAATLRQLTMFARQAQQSGHEVRTCGASPTLRKIAGLLRIQADLGLV